VSLSDKVGRSAMAVAPWRTWGWAAALQIQTAERAETASWSNPAQVVGM